MPKVSTHKCQGRSAEAMKCCKCSDGIIKGDDYYQWAIKSQRGGTVYRQHCKHGAVRQSRCGRARLPRCNGEVLALNRICASGSRLGLRLSSLRLPRAGAQSCSSGATLHGSNGGKVKRDKYRWRLSRCLYGVYLLLVDTELQTLLYGSVRHSAMRKKATP